ncbi:hypothetical protein BST97_05985 [Nonlabens spongiae]|uniref:VWA domain-containing protein n=1 Tax=Nonlabens spongiae TaxID=331648 RepID=A0A1W6MIY9_9FLAO|nr:hypothetical protein [Nonlabens spongiae]ARN77575.1 hypothetical protein BST97_05985 [Nonlabens spongiae]
MTVLWILIAALVAAFIAFFQYGSFFSKNKTTSWGFGVLRFFTVLTILLLLLLPVFRSTEYETELPKLIILADDSESVEYLSQTDNLKQDFRDLIANNDLSERFDVNPFSFDSYLKPANSLTLRGKQSDLQNALSEILNLYKDDQKAIVVLSDGIQNSGTSYEYLNLPTNTKLYPIVYGDTTRYADLEITQINLNRYSYLNNEFPVEAIVNYSGEDPVRSRFTVSEGNEILYSQDLSFGANSDSEIINFELKSTSVGLKSMRAQVTPLDNEKNKENNSRSFAVEVIDEQAKILIHASAPHPDLGALKKAIQSNPQRSAEILFGSQEADYNAYNLVILYGVDSAFSSRIDRLNESGLNAWFILGKNSRLDILNQSLPEINIEENIETDEVQPLINFSYSNFNLEEFDYGDYPPVETPYGSWSFNTPVDVLVYKKISGIETDQPFWFTYESGSRRIAVSALNGLWRWRSQAYLENKNFEDFDDLVNGQIQYLASNQLRNRLTVDAPAIFEQTNVIKIEANYLDKNYQFDNNAVLDLKIVMEENDSTFTRPFVLAGSLFQVDLAGLDAGSYKYTVSVQNENLTRTGFFEVMDFNPEQTTTTAYAQGFEKLVGSQNVYYQGDLDKVIDALSSDQIARPIERKKFAYLGLIDFEYLMILLGLLLGAEWFLRKYNGLI